MASILKVDELRGIASAGDITVTSEGGAATQSLQQGLAKAWSEFITSVAINDSFNVASMSDEGVGDYQTNLTNSMASTAYVAIGDVENFNAYLTTTDKTSSSWTNYTSRDSEAGLADLTDMQNVAHGDLA